MTIITLTTDFGEQDGYVGMMKGVIHSINPTAQIIDISHQVEPQNVLQGAFLLHNAHKYFPPGTIHLAVVDPGLGDERRNICLEVRGVGVFIGPDNGLFSYILDAYPVLVAREPTVQAYHRSVVSNLFYGRDIFAPVAAHLSRGEPVERIGSLVETAEVACFEDLWPQWEQRGSKSILQGRVSHIDHFGNIISNIHRRQLEELDPAKRGKVSVFVEYTSRSSNQKKRLEVNGLRATYGQGKVNDLIALYGSSDYLELARVNGYAAFEDVDLSGQGSQSIRLTYKQPVVQIGAPFVVEVSN